MAGDEQRDQVVAHLRVVHLLAAQVDEEAQHRRVRDLGVVLVLQVLQLLGVARLEALVDEAACGGRAHGAAAVKRLGHGEAGQGRWSGAARLGCTARSQAGGRRQGAGRAGAGQGGAPVEDAVEQVHVLVELLEPRDEVVGAGDLPVRRGSERAVLDLGEGADGRLDHGRLLVDRAELIVEDGLADDVEGERAVPLLHVEHPPLLCRLEQLRDQVGVRLAKLAHHPRQVELVEARGDRAPPVLPRLIVGRDEALAHDVLEDQGQCPLVVVVWVLAQDVPRDHLVRVWVWVKELALG